MHYHSLAVLSQSLPATLIRDTFRASSFGAHSSLSAAPNIVPCFLLINHNALLTTTIALQHTPPLLSLHSVLVGCQQQVCRLFG